MRSWRLWSQVKIWDDVCEEVLWVDRKGEKRAHFMVMWHPQVDTLIWWESCCHVFMMKLQLDPGICQLQVCKIDVGKMDLKWILIPTNPLLLGYKTCDLYELVSIIATFLRISRAHINILFISKVMIPVVIYCRSQ